MIAFTSFQGEIKNLETFGMLVSVSDHIKGLCPKMHFADISLQHPEKKFSKGKVVKCRVSQCRGSLQKASLFEFYK